jgi:PAS domain S-box-containing protein
MTGPGPLEQAGGQAPRSDPGAEQTRLSVDDSLLAQLVRDLADAVVIADAEGSIVFWNRAATSLFGWSAAETAGRSLDLIIPERLRDRHWRGYRRVMETGHTDYGNRLLEVPALHRDGHTISVAFTVTLLTSNLTSHGNVRPKGIAAVLRDDTARWQERRRTRDRLAVLESSDGAPRSDM